MPKKQYRNHSAELKVTIVRRHLIDKIPVSTLCEEYSIRASQFYAWQKELFELALKGYNATQLPQQMAKDKSTIKHLETKLMQKNEVLAELAQELMNLKKESGEI